MYCDAWRDKSVRMMAWHAAGTNSRRFGNAGSPRERNDRERKTNVWSVPVVLLRGKHDLAFQRRRAECWFGTHM